MDIRKLQRVIVDGLEDVKAQNIVVFNTEHLSSLFERVIIASGTSNRQTKSLASSVREAVKSAGFAVPRTEGETNGEWIIVDCGAAVVHVMQPTIREYYHLEEIWGDKPVNMKIDTSVRKLVKAAEPDAAPAKKTAAKKATAKQTVAKKAASKKAASKTASSTEKAAEKGLFKPRAAEAPVAERAPAKKAAATKAPAKKLTATKAVAAPAVAKRPPAKKVAAKKAAPAAKRTVTRTTGVKQAAPRTIVINSPSAKSTPKRSAAKKPASKRAPARKAAVRSV